MRPARPQVDDVRAVLADGAVTSHLQPIVDLGTGAVVAYEALARGPHGPLAAPTALFEAARRDGVLAELDALCRASAVRTARHHGLGPQQWLFVNVEPEVLDTAPLADLLALASDAAGDVRVVLEITERAVGARPAELLMAVEAVRSQGWRIALDDVGADDMSLAMMPLLRPDVVKLDLRLVQSRPGPEVTSIVHAVSAYAEETGAVVLAEGIETERHVDAARQLGAVLGQGWYLGRPGPHLAGGRGTGVLDLPLGMPSRPHASPFDCLPAGTATRLARKSLLVEMSKHLEREAVKQGSTCLLLSTFQLATHFTERTRARYEAAADGVAFVAALGVGLEPGPARGVRGAHIAATDPIAGEWDVVVLSPHFAAALLARDCGDQGPDDQRRFEFAVTYRRDAVLEAARALLSRVAPEEAASARSVLHGDERAAQSR